jgi:hypothetical protein
LEGEDSSSFSEEYDFDSDFDFDDDDDVDKLREEDRDNDALDRHTWRYDLRTVIDDEEGAQPYRSIMVTDRLLVLVLLGRRRLIQIRIDSIPKIATCCVVARVLSTQVNAMSVEWGSSS